MEKALSDGAPMSLPRLEAEGFDGNRARMENDSKVKSRIGALFSMFHIYFPPPTCYFTRSSCQEAASTHR